LSSLKEKAKTLNELLLTEKWNSIEAIAEDLDAFVIKNRKVCLDIVEVQSLIGFVIDDHEIAEGRNNNMIKKVKKP